MAFFIGYLMAAVGPVAFGALRDATGTFTPVFATLTILAVLTLLVALAAAPRPALNRAELSSQRNPGPRIR
jgi:CP family cyanate transporter-like MFS transporter